MTDFPEFSLFWWLQGCRVPTRLAISPLERKGCLGKSREKTRALKIKTCDNSIQKRGGRGSAFPCIAQLPDLGSSFWQAPGGWKFAALCVSAIPAPSPP